MKAVQKHSSPPSTSRLNTNAPGRTRVTSACHSSQAVQLSKDDCLNIRLQRANGTYLGSIRRKTSRWKLRPASG